MGSVFALSVALCGQLLEPGSASGRVAQSLDKEENVSDVFWQPLVICIAGFILLFVTMVLLRTRTEISVAAV